MNHEQDHAGCDLAKRDPALLFIVNFIALGQRAGVLKHKRGGFETDPVFDQIALALPLVELESHGAQPFLTIFLVLTTVNTVVLPLHR